MNNISTTTDCVVEPTSATYLNVAAQKTTVLLPTPVCTVMLLLPRRSEPEQADLAATAVTIWQAAHATSPDAAKSRILEAVAAAYFCHYNMQSQADFHGLRDYYGLVRTLRLQPQLSPVQLYRALLRNFGGPPELVQQVRGQHHWIEQG